MKASLINEPLVGSTDSNNAFDAAMQDPKAGTTLFSDSEGPVDQEASVR